MKFQNYWTNLIDFEVELNKGIGNLEQLNFNINTYCERLLQHISKFRQEWIIIFENIIDDFCKNEFKQTYSPVQDIFNEYKIFCSDDDLEYVKIYIEKKIMFKIIPCEFDFNYKWNSFQRDFNSMDALFDTLYIHSREYEIHQLRIPLSWILNYKGFRCLAIGLVPLEEYSLRLGINSNNSFIKNQTFFKIMTHVGEILNLKDIKCIFKGLTIHEDVPVSTHIKVYVYQKGDNSDEEEKDNKYEERHFIELQYEIK